MNFHVTQETVSMQETLFESSMEQPVDMELLLPDYCPDISRILFCRLTPSVSSRQLSGDQLMVEGEARVKLLYVDDGGSCVRGYEQIQPFNVSFPMKKALESPVIEACATVEYMNYRAVSQRRVDIHGAFTVSVRVSGCAGEDIIVDADGDGVQMKKSQCPVSNIVGMAQRPFTVNEVLELGQGRGVAEAVLRSEVTAVVDDYKAISNKIIVKGTANIRVLYISDLSAGTMELMEQSLPISQIIDLDGVADDCVCDVHFEVLSSQIQPRSDSGGEYRLLGCDLRLCAAATAYREAQIPLVADVYSTQYEMETESRPVTLEQVLEVLSENGVYKTRCDLPEEPVASIADIWCEAGAPSAGFGDEGLSIKVPVTVCVLAADNAGEPVYFERNVELDSIRPFKMQEGEIRCDPQLVITGAGYTLGSTGQMELRLDYRLEGTVRCVRQTRAMCRMDMDEERPVTRENNAALTIYYAQKAENLWDIARRYRTSIDAIREENEMDTDVMPQQGMLLIPIC
ncbi:MAG: DUF3794 domain-containing protein [Clostridiales bacterium]|nr:DUF3794 domain-containing protein [Clostridiales bacterium]